MLLFLIKITLLTMVTVFIAQFLQAPLGLLPLFAIAFMGWFLLGMLAGSFGNNNDEYDEIPNNSSIAMAFVKGIFWGVVVGLLILGMLHSNLFQNSCSTSFLKYLSAIPISNMAFLTQASDQMAIAMFIGWWALVGGIIGIALSRNFIGAFIACLIIIGLVYSHSMMIAYNYDKKLQNSLTNLRGVIITDTTTTQIQPTQIEPTQVQIQQSTPPPTQTQPTQTQPMQTQPTPNPPPTENLPPPENPS